MSNAVKSIENAVEQLGRNDLAVFRECFSTFDAAEWDAQIEVGREFLICEPSGSCYTR